MRFQGQDEPGLYLVHPQNENTPCDVEYVDIPSFHCANAKIGVSTDISHEKNRVRPRSYGKADENMEASRYWLYILSRSSATAVTRAIATRKSSNLVIWISCRRRLSNSPDL